MALAGAIATEADSSILAIGAYSGLPESPIQSDENSIRGLPKEPLSIENMPELSTRYRYFVVLGVLLALGLSMLVYLRSKKII